MDPIAAKLMSAAGAAEAPLYVDDVFSTFVYAGTGFASQTINNGIDLSGEGGLVWFKNRQSISVHRLVDTERGATKSLRTDSTSVESTQTDGLTAFTSTGFTVSSHSNYNAQKMCTWTFRKAPGFFDVVTYTGNSTAGRTISHNLGSVPGFIMVKATSGSSTNWVCYHRSLGNDYAIYINTTEKKDGPNKPSWDQTTPTSTEFTVGGWGYSVNDAGVNYVAYLFAHDAAEFGTGGNESIIKCDSYTGTGTGGHSINLGFEPQWLMIKNASDDTGPDNTDQDWLLFDNMRGVVPATNPYSGGDKTLVANTYNAEVGYWKVEFHSRGFTLKGQDDNWSGDDFIYVAIRRPHKPPSAATEVFKPVVAFSRGNVPTGFPVDMVLFGDNSNSWGYNWNIQNRLTGGTQVLITSRTIYLELATATSEFDHSVKFVDGWVSGGTNAVYETFRRAAGFYDIVAYTGNNTANQQFAHNLGAVPELIITKVRNSYNRNWAVYSSVTGTGKWLELNNDTQAQTGSGKFDTAPTSTIFYVSHDSSFMTGGGGNYVAHLFATLNGISKVGSYTGTGNDIDVDCGFTAGARFVMIKRTDSTGDWYVWDSARGIVSGNDPYFLINDETTYYGSVSGTDYIDPLNAGFTVTSSAPNALNASGGTYLFLAIA